MTEQELASNLKNIEEQRAALVTQLEKVQSASTVGNTIVEYIENQLKDLDEEVIQIVVKEIVKSLKPYGVMSQGDVEGTTQKRTRKQKEEKEVTTIEGMVVINERLGAKKQDDGNYSVYIGVDNKRSADKSASTTGKWQQYLKEEYGENSEVIENTTVIAGKFLITAQDLLLSSVGDLANLDFTQSPDSEKNQVNGKKPPLALNADLSKIGSELITESIMEAETVGIIPNLSMSKADIIPVGTKIRTQAYGKWMEGTITKFVPEDSAKPYRADLEGLPIEGHLPADAIELLGELAEMSL